MNHLVVVVFEAWPNKFEQNDQSAGLLKNAIFEEIDDRQGGCIILLQYAYSAELINSKYNYGFQDRTNNNTLWKHSAKNRS